MAGSVKINHLLWLSPLNVAGEYSDSSGADKRMFWSAVFRLLCIVIIQVKNAHLLRQELRLQATCIQFV